MAKQRSGLSIDFGSPGTGTIQVQSPRDFKINRSQRSLARIRKIAGQAGRKLPR